jgi:hypothetical protein
MSLQGKKRQSLPIENTDNLVRDSSFHVVIQILNEKEVENRPSVIERFNRIFAGTGIYMDYR